VKVPLDAEPGSTVTCPDCDEVFTPPQLVPKGPVFIYAYRHSMWR